MEVRMSKVNVACDVKIYEIDGEEVELGAEQSPLQVKSHWNDSERVVLTIGKKTVTVAGHDLFIAVQNCMRTK